MPARTNLSLLSYPFLSSLILSFISQVRKFCEYFNSKYVPNPDIEKMDVTDLGGLERIF